MGLPLLLPLLLPASLQAECNSKYGYDVNQPEHLSAPEGGSIHIPFSFCYSWELARVPSVSIFWRWKDFHGEIIYNMTSRFIHKNYKNRLFLNWTEGWRSGSLRISNLRREDACTYFCRVQLTTLRHGKKVWQSLKGTKLTISQEAPQQQQEHQLPLAVPHDPAETLVCVALVNLHHDPTITAATKKTTQSPTSTATTTITADLGVSGGKSSSGSWPLTPGAIVGVALSGAVLIITILGLMIYLRWKRSKGLRTKASASAGGSFQNTEHENTGNKGQHRNPKLDPKDDSILYASLALSTLTSPSAPPCHSPESPQEETLYTIIKA